MARHLLHAGYAVGVFNRTPERARSLIDAGARWFESPAKLAAGVDVLITMLGYPADVRETLLGEGGVIDALGPGSLLIDMTTSQPSLAVEIYTAARAMGLDALDAPVSGGDVGAQNATLAIMVGGDPEAFQRAVPILQCLGSKVDLQGGAGCGQHTKMTNQLAIASGMIGVCEALLYAYRAGLDVEKAIEMITTGAAGSWSLSNYGPRLIHGDLEPGFKIDHFIKDLGIALAEARRMDVALPGAALAEQLYIGARSQGLGGKGTQALAVVLARLSSIDWPAS